MSVVGKTDDGKLVVRGIFEIMSSTVGLPLEFIIQILKTGNMLVDWVDFYEMSREHKWKWKTTRERIRYSTKEILGPEQSNEILLRLEEYQTYRGYED